MEAREAVALAKKHVAAMFEAEPIKEVGLEEIELQGDSWSVDHRVHPGVANVERRAAFVGRNRTDLQDRAHRRQDRIGPILAASRRNLRIGEPHRLIPREASSIGTSCGPPRVPRVAPRSCAASRRTRRRSSASPKLMSPLLPWDGHVVSSEADYGYEAPNSRRKVLLWSREPWGDIDETGHLDMPPGRFVRATTRTSAGELTVMGVCIPWSGSRTGPAFTPRTP